MPDIKNCRNCGKIFTYNAGRQLCPNCRGKEEEDFKKVKEYLYKNPGASISEIASQLEISMKKIKSYLREGRLEIIGGEEGNMVLDCVKCGKAIKSGKYCSECQANITRNLNDEANKLRNASTGEEKKNKSIGMRYLHKDDKRR